MTEDVKRIYLVLVVPVLVLALLIGFLATSANAARPDDGYDPALNQPSYWGDDCTKTEQGLQGPRWYTPVNEGYRLVVLKSSTDNDVFSNVPADTGVETVSGKDISHVIYCGSDTVVTIPPTPTVPPVTDDCSWNQGWESVPDGSCLILDDLPPSKTAVPVDGDPKFTG